MTADARARALLRTADRAVLHMVLDSVLRAARSHDEDGREIDPDWLARFVAHRLYLWQRLQAGNVDD